jgi:N-acetylglucosamine-6-phosphate deacetylase
MTVDMKVIKKALEVCRALKEESKTWEGSAILGCHAEGPFISAAKKGAQDPKFILKPDAKFVKEYADIIRIISLAPEEDTENFDAIKEIRRDTDVVMSIGHTSADYDTAMKSTEVGMRHVTHLFNAMTALAHRAPGVVTAALNSDVSCELIVDTFHVNPALYDILWKIKGRKLCFITDCLPAGGLPEGEYTLGGAKIIYRGIVCRLEDGTVAGSVLHLNKGVWNVYTNSNIPLWECVNGASLNPATTLGIDKTKGSIEVGKDADIIITDNEFNVQKTTERIESLKNLCEDVSGFTGIGHTRWATHGAPTTENAHPHLSYNKKFAVVHNGIIENYLELKEELESEGYVFKSNTDTEVIPNLLEKYYKGDIKKAVLKTVARLKGHLH